MALLNRLRKILNFAELEKVTEKNGLHHTFYSPNGDEYSGEWKDDLRHGQGTQVWKRCGCKYEGEWKRDVYDGYGTLYRLQPSTKEYIKVYVGTWRNGKKEGTGTYYYSTSTHYDGQWIENERSGKGKMIYENGDVYEGEWLKDKPHGQGVMSHRNGNRYEGYLKNGLNHGYGCYIDVIKGHVLEGLWVQNMFKSGTVSEYDRNDAHHTPPPHTVMPKDADILRMDPTPAPAQPIINGPSGTIA